MGPIYRDRAVVLGETLVVADFHLGREQSANLELSVGSERAIVTRLDDLLGAYDVSEVVIAGDVLESFDSLPPAVASAFERITDCIADHDCKLIVTPGNHDVLLDALWDGPAPSEYELADGKTVVLHGHERPETDADRYVIGHDHPAIEIEGRKRACYLSGAGAFRGADVLVLPAFNELVAGVRINGMRTAAFHSPLITDADAFRPILRDEVAEETLEFPPLGSLRDHL